MSAQDIILGARVAHVRELRAEVERLKAENAALREASASLRAHFDLALLAAADLRDGGELEVWDGWNLILGSAKEARGRDELVARAQACGRRVWIVFDGPDEAVRRVDARVRVSYTGGTGEQRADRLICDFVRMAAFLGLADRVTVRTHDKALLAQIRRLGGAG